MAYATEGFEIEYGVEFEIEFAEANYSRGAEGRVFSPEAFEIEVDDLLPAFAESNYSRGADGRVYNPLAFEIDVEDHLPQFAEGGYSNSRSSRPGSFSQGFEIGIDAIQYLPSDTGFEIFIGDVEPPTLHFSNMIEIIYPVKPLSTNSRVLFQAGTEEWRASKEGAAVTVQEIDTMRFRVDRDHVATFLGDLDAARLTNYRLTTSGYTPFGTTSQDNWVLVMTRSRPRREQGGDFYLVEATFRFMGVYS